MSISRFPPLPQPLLKRYFPACRFQEWHVLYGTTAGTNRCDHQMNEPEKPENDEPSPPACESCVNTFRTQTMMNILICVPHLKIMPANNPICDLYSAANQKK